MTDETVIRLVTVIVLGVVLVAAVVMVGIVAVLTDRDATGAGLLTAGGVILVAALGGVAWRQVLPRHRWRVHLDHNGDDDGPPPG